MWQPEQPSSQTVATRGLVTAHAPRCEPASTAGTGAWSCCLRPLAVPSRTGPPSGRPGRTCRSSCRLATRPRGSPCPPGSRVSRPRCITSHVCAPSISSQTRTQRRHRMQRLWSRVNRRWRRVDVHLGADPRQLEVVDALLVRGVLQLAVVVGHADRTDVVPLQEHHLRHRATVVPELLGMGRDLHALGDLGHAGGGQPGRAVDLHDAHAAGAAVVDARQVAEARDIDPVLLRDLHDRLAFVARDVLAVDRQGVDGHAITSAGCSISQTPAGHLLSTMWARYSSRK